MYYCTKILGFYYKIFTNCKINIEFIIKFKLLLNFKIKNLDIRLDILNK